MKAAAEGVEEIYRSDNRSKLEYGQSATRQDANADDNVIVVGFLGFSRVQGQMRHPRTSARYDESKGELNGTAKTR